MVVGYRVNWLTYWIAKAMLKVPYIAMGNLLAGEMLATEFVQQRCQGELLAGAVAAMLDDPARCRDIEQRYDAIHRSLRLDSASLAADAIAELLKQKKAVL
jgi:lipid-A-disaccharide synthase